MNVQYIPYIHAIIVNAMFCYICFATSTTLPLVYLY